MTDIIVAGYPKSGNTWVTRLVAELVGCPVAGFWGAERKELAQEGAERISEFRCFKAHQQFCELRTDNAVPRERFLVYVVRDPRDIVVSAAHYFFIERRPALGRLICSLPGGRGVYRKLVNRLLTTRRYRIERMVHAVLHGSPEINSWTGISWAAHCKPFVESGCLVIKYEDLLDQPVQECAEILSRLGLKRDEDKIRGAISRQSFDRKKEAFLASNDIAQARFLRVGKKEQWRRELTPEQKGLFSSVLASELRLFGYPADP